MSTTVQSVNREERREAPTLGRRYRIAIVTSIHPDFDARLWKYAKLVRDLGHETHLVCPWSIADGTQFEGVHFHTFPPAASRLKRLWQVPRRVLGKLLPLLKRIDLVHFHDLDLLPVLAPLSLVKPVVYDVHENYSEDMLHRDYIPRPLRPVLYHGVYFVQLVLSRIVHNVVLVSHHQELRDFKSDRLHKGCIRNFASLELLQSVKDDYMARADAVVFTGSQNAANGSLLLLEIAELTHRQASGIIFYSPDRFWSPAFRETFMAERARRGLDDVVRLLPNVRPHLLVEATLNRATIAISPNLRVPQQVRGAHNKIFEFMAAGLPIVCSDLPDQVDEVEGNDCGLLARPEDPASFVTAILKLAGDRALARRLGQNGQKAFRERYSWEAQGPALQKFYDEILASGVAPVEGVEPVNA